MRSLKLMIIAAGALAVSAPAAFADIACNDDGDCWHVKEKHEYKPEFRVHVHPDNWKWDEKDHARYRWREHEGRGYWRSGVWIGF